VRADEAVRSRDDGGLGCVHGRRCSVSERRGGSRQRYF
jgi:hypothetical protein